MFKRLTILTLFVWCLFGSCNILLAQEGGEGEFGKKNQQPEVEESNPKQVDTNNSNEAEQDERPALQPSQIIKQSDESKAGVGNNKPVKTDTLNQSSTAKPKQNASKSKYNSLFYHFYKLKHEETDNKSEG